MNKARGVALIAVLGLTVGAGLLLGQEATRVGNLRVVKYDGLKDEVLRNRGKVVLVDFWGEFCAPCKANFPRIVHLHRLHARKGLAVISVSIDNLNRSNPDEQVHRIRTFLITHGANFANLVLDEPPDVLRDRLRISSVPCYYVFSRQGKWTQFTGNVDYEAMERLVVDLLAQ